MNGPTIDRGKTPVEFRGLCLRLSATALKKEMEMRSQDLYLSFSFPAGTSIRASMSCLLRFSLGELLSVEL